MNVGFSSSVCPDWDLTTIVEQARNMGFVGIELAGLAGHPFLASSPALADTAGVQKLLSDAGVRLMCLASECRFHDRDRRIRAEQKQRLSELLELSARLGCPYVVVRTGSIPRFQTRDRVLGRIVEALRELAPQAAGRRVGILVENEGRLAGSRDVWYILDAVGHPAVRACWNPTWAQAAGDSPSLAVPRMGGSIQLTHMMDATFGPHGGLRQYVSLGQGQTDLSRYLTLMRGLGSQSPLIISWPAPDPPPNPEQMLPTALAWINEQLNRIDQKAELSAYKGDKHAPRHANSGSRATANG